MITVDLRIDNRDDLLGRLSLNSAACRGMVRRTSAALCLGEVADRIFSMLRGPFAVAIWDGSKRSLTLARDHLGLNVLMWHRDKHSFAFATMPNGLFAFDNVQRELCEEKIADFLVLNHADHAGTIYRNIFRIPPAHLMRCWLRRLTRAAALLGAR